NVLHTPVNAAPTNPDNTSSPVAGAVSLGNTRVLVSFNEAVGDSALDKANYSVVRTLGGTEAKALDVKSITFVNPNIRTTVILETASQAEGTYALTAVNLKDFSGDVMAPVRVSFVGSPLSGVPQDSDGDLVSDVVEQRGWKVAVKML